MADTDLFDEVIQRRNADPGFEPGMDAAIACFIALGGPQALDRIERDYLSNSAADYSDCFAAINAIRVHGTELQTLERKRLARSLRLVLDRPLLADLVIPDLARWKDWSAVDQMVTLFEISTEETQLLKPVIVRYLKMCPLPAGTEALERIRAIDARAVQLAESSMNIWPGFATIPVPPTDNTRRESENPPSVRVAEEPNGQPSAR